MQIEIKNVSFTYSPKTPNEYKALKGVNFSVHEGEFLTIVGQTGSGKSTLLQLLNGLELPTSGEVVIDGQTTKEICKKNKTTRLLRKKIGVVFQFPEYQLFEETIEKDVAFGMINYGMEKEKALKKAREYVLQVGLDETYFTKSPFEISGGEKRKVAIAGILALNPDVLVFDEPTAGLDPKSKVDFLQLIEFLRQKGKTIIVVTHSMLTVLRFATHVVMLDDGQVIFDGNTSDFFMDERVSNIIEIPNLLKMSKELIKRGVKLDITKIQSTAALIEQIKKWKAQNE